MENFKRTGYGEICLANPEQHSLIGQARALIDLAIKAKKLPKAFDNLRWDKKGRSTGGALHHELYDISPNGNQCLVCIRSSAGGRYGVATTGKLYYIVSRHARGTRTAPASLAMSAKYAKSALRPGDAILALGAKK